MRFTSRTLIRSGLSAAGLSLIVACSTTPPPKPPEAAKPPPVQAPAPATPYTPPPLQQRPTTQQNLPPPVVSNRVGPGTVQDFVVNVGDRVYFDFDSFAIRADAQPVLNAQAAWLARYPGVQVRIEGNADERGTQEYNFALGERRANSVRDYLVSHGVATSRITVVSYGKERPIDPGSTEDAWQHNRNGHTAIIGGAPQ